MNAALAIPVGDLPESRQGRLARDRAHHPRSRSCVGKHAGGTGLPRGFVVFDFEDLLRTFRGKTAEGASFADRILVKADRSTSAVCQLGFCALCNGESRDGGMCCCSHHVPAAVA